MPARGTSGPVSAHDAVLLRKGALVARLAQSREDVVAAQSLRGLCFHGGGLEIDAFDPKCSHVLIEQSGGTVLGCFRMQLLTGPEIRTSYAARFYDVSALARTDPAAGPLVEIGRFCIHPDHSLNPDVLRLAWGAMTAFVDRSGTQFLFGCSSFAGTDPAAYLDSFALLAERHLAPPDWAPRIKAPQVYRFAQRTRGAPDIKRARAQMPPLLRTYLMMGGQVSDHAVIDRDMNTLHVFTGVAVAAIPEARKRLLRAVAG